MKISPISLILLFFSSCNQVKDQGPISTERIDTITTIKNEEKFTSDYGINPHPKIEDYYTLDTINNQVINEKSFVLIYPTEKQLKEAKDFNESNFYVWREDNEYWMSELKKIAKQKGIKTITATKRKLTFISQDKKYTVDLDKKEEGNLFDYNLIIFTPEREPLFAGFVQPNEKFFNDYFDLKEIPCLQDQLFYKRFN